MRPAAIRSREEQYDAVRKELENHALAVTSVDEQFLIRARDAMANVESAFNTKFHQFRQNGKVFRSNITMRAWQEPPGSTSLQSPVLRATRCTRSTSVLSIR